MLGPPAAGKGTQGELLAKRFRVPHVSTGAIFRAAISSGDPVGQQAKEYIDRGLLVPDEISIQIVRQRLEAPDCRRGFILDGFPRTLPQAVAFEQTLGEMGQRLSAAVYIRISPEEAIRRIAARRVCAACGMTIGPQDSGANEPPERCPECGGQLYQREDDNEETARRRLEVYVEETRPVVDFYLRHGLLLEVDGEQDVQAVFDDIYGRLVSGSAGASGVAT